MIPENSSSIPQVSFNSKLCCVLSWHLSSFSRCIFKKLDENHWSPILPFNTGNNIQNNSKQLKAKDCLTLLFWKPRLIQLFNQKQALIWPRSVINSKLKCQVGRLTSWSSFAIFNFVFVIFSDLVELQKLWSSELSRSINIGVQRTLTL